MSRRVNLTRSLATEDGKPIVEAGIDAAARGQADWCRGCGKLRYRHDMRWLVDVYACRACLGAGVGQPAVWLDPWTDFSEPLDDMIRNCG